MVGVKVGDERVVQAGSTGREVTLDVVRDHGSRRTRCIGVRIGLRDTVGSGTGVDEESGSIGEDEECRVPATGGDLMDVQRTWSPRWEGCLCREETGGQPAEDPRGR